MSKIEERFPDKQCIEGICQFCGKDGYYDEEKMRDCQEIEEGWVGLSDVTAQMGGIYGEWCSKECFWNDLFCLTTTESVDEYEEKKNQILKKLGRNLKRDSP